LNVLSARIAITLLVLACVPGAVADAPPKGYVCVRARMPIVIDGKLDDPSWADAPWTDSFEDIEGDRKPQPRFRTRAKMLWDDQFFYVAAELEEPHVWGTLTRHDSVIFHDNDFEIFIDPDGDNQEYYEIEINALNTEWDLFLKKAYRNGGPAINEWEIPGLKTAIQVNGTLNDPSDRDTSWTIEFAIPWKVLAEHAHRPAPPKDGDQWRVNFSRVEWKHIVEGKTYKKIPNTPEDNWVWSPQGAVDMHRPERWGFVQFSTARPGQASYTPDPANPVRERLMAIYHAERTYRAKHKTWAASLDVLGMNADPVISGATPPRIKLSPTGFEASIAIGGPPERVWTVREDSRLSRSDR
jgi:hypothetical protein